MHAHLLDLLVVADGRDEWAAPTICAPWSVKDLAAHIVADDLGHLSWHATASRVGFAGADGWDELVAVHQRQNAQWVGRCAASAPPSSSSCCAPPATRFVAHLRTLDLAAIGPTVDWAGPGPHPMWLHVAREYTERWSHQQQIRDAVELAPA